jgi:dTMP kinase
LTIILDLDPEAGLARAAARPGAEARFESKGLAFHQRLRNGFLAIARENSKRCRVIDAQRPISEVAADVLRIILAHLKLD